MEPNEFEKFWASMEVLIQTEAMKPIFKALVLAAWKRGREQLREEFEDETMRGESRFDMIRKSRKQDSRV